MFSAPRSGNDPSTLDDPDDNRHGRQDQQDVDEPTKGARGNDSQEPEGKQTCGDCPEHMTLIPFP
jgi:hypothetical protein